MDMDIVLAIGAVAGIGIGALRIAESWAQRQDDKASRRDKRVAQRIADEKRRDEESIDRAVTDAQALIRGEISKAHGLPMDDDDVRPLHWREQAALRWISLLEQNDSTTTS